MSSAARSYSQSDAADLAASSPYLDAIRAHPLLTAADERDLAGRIAAGDLAARDRLVESNLRLVVMTARKYLGRGTPFEDLIAEGNLGLFQAATDYDPGKGTRFATYAVYWIKQSILRAVMNTGSTIRLPCHVHTLLGKWRRAEREIRRQVRRDPAAWEVAGRLGLGSSQLGMVGLAARTRNAGTAGEGGLAEVCREEGAAHQGVDAADEAAALRGCVGRLPKREREVLTLRYGLDGQDPVTLPEAGRRMGCSREWVRRLEIAAIDNLRAMVPGADGVAGRARVVAARKAATIAPAVPTRVCVICGSAFATDRRRRFTQLTCSKPCLSEQKSISGRRHAGARAASR